MSNGSWRRGLVVAVDGTSAKVRVVFPDLDGLKSDWLPVIQASSHGLRLYALPPLGSQVVVLLDEHGEDGAVLGAIYSQADPPPSTDPRAVVADFPDGSRLLWANGALQVDASSVIRLKAPGLILEGPTRIEGDVEIQGSGTVTGHWKAQGDTSAHHTHPVSGSVAQRGD